MRWRKFRDLAPARAAQVAALDRATRRLGVAIAMTALVVSSSCIDRPLVARRITAATAARDLLGGADATGGVGDWVLSNGVVDAIVDDVGWQTDLLEAGGPRVPIQTSIAATGGFLVDLGSHDHDDDALAVLLPVNDPFGTNAFYALPAGEVLGDASLPSVIAQVDEAAGEARLKVYGLMWFRPVAGPPAQVPFRQIYSLRRDEAFLRIRTEIDNPQASPLVLTGLADTSVLGRGGAMAFVPHPKRGFSLTGAAVKVPFVTQYGVIRPGDGPAGDGGRPAGEVSYTVLPSDDSWLVDASSDSVLLAGPPSPRPPIEPGGTGVYERRIYVGRRGDVASSAAPALALIASRRGLPSGALRGRIVDPNGLPFRAVVEITLDDLTPATPARETLITAYDGDVSPQRLVAIRTDSSPELGGSFSAKLPAGHYTAQISIEDRDPIAAVDFAIPPNGTADLGTFTLPSIGSLEFDVTDASSGSPLPARIVLKGLGNPDPKLGEPLDLLMDGLPVGVPGRAALPWGNNVYSAAGSGEVPLRPGRYRVIATRGIEYDVQWQDVTVSAGASAFAAFALTRQVDTSGWLASDFHVHAAPSADSSVPPADRLAMLVAEGIEVLVSADHDVIYDYTPVIDSLGVGAWITSRVGAEVSSIRSPVPSQRRVGHYVGWPLAYDPHARRNGAPEDEWVPPSAIIDRLRARGAAVVQLNHPLWDTLGLLYNLAYDPLAPLTTVPNAFLLENSPLGTGTRNLDFDAIEILNGATQTQFEAARDIWLGLLAQGESLTATAASDTHGLQPQGTGTPRSYVAHAPDDPAQLDGAAFDDAVAAMRVVGTTGPFLEAELEGPGATAGLGETLAVTPGATLALHLRVQAPCWIQTGSVRVFLNGALFIDVPIDGTPCTGPMRFDGDVTLAPVADTMITVETVERLPRDTSSFDKQLSSFVLGPRTLRAFTNPIFVDTDGNGRFDAPGL